MQLFLIGLSVGINNSSSSVRLVAAFSCTAWNGNMITHIVVVDQPPPEKEKLVNGLTPEEIGHKKSNLGAG